MNKTLPILGNAKEQQQIKFYKKLLGKLIFLRVSKNLVMLILKCYISLTGWGRVLKE